MVFSIPYVHRTSVGEVAGTVHGLHYRSGAVPKHSCGGDVEPYWGAASNNRMVCRGRQITMQRVLSPLPVRANGCTVSGAVAISRAIAVVKLVVQNPVDDVL
ncbi:hypothetical protein CCHOA_10990 [Corynebacterium choanae]|uniref:Uncharacterized protein n=1 Tax=Corynebacterium choanae TaxID=1862358 RepID=A0A3G6J9A3_9CORY|nr:hypothetical protein CCHOA_10990 [Corynebacterium choanae]